MALEQKLNEIDAQRGILLNYANEVTKAGDTKLGDAIKTLADGYGKGDSKEGYAEGTIDVVTSTRFVEMNHNLNTNEDIAFMYWCDFEDLKTMGVASRTVAEGGVIRGSGGIFKNGIELPYANIPFDDFVNNSCWSIATNSTGLGFGYSSKIKKTREEVEVTNHSYYSDENTLVVRSGAAIGNTTKIHWCVWIPGKPKDDKWILQEEEHNSVLIKDVAIVDLENTTWSTTIKQIVNTGTGSKNFKKEIYLKENCCNVVHYIQVDVAYKKGNILPRSEGYKVVRNIIATYGDWLEQETAYTTIGTGFNTHTYRYRDGRNQHNYVSSSFGVYSSAPSSNISIDAYGTSSAAAYKLSAYGIPPVYLKLDSSKFSILAANDIDWDNTYVRYGYYVFIKPRKIIKPKQEIAEVIYDVYSFRQGIDFSGFAKRE